ncbi:MAG: hypothetical protein ACI4SF_11980 [Oscillospiraceae bacterium]
MNISQELLDKAKTAKSAGELFELAKAKGIDLPEGEAANFFSELNKIGELSDEELDNVAGGCGYESGPRPLFSVGDRVYWYENGNEKEFGTIKEVFPKSPQFRNQFPYAIYADKGGCSTIAEEHLHKL